MQVKIIYPKGQFGSTEDQVFDIVADGPQGNLSDTEVCDAVFRMMNRVDGSYVERYLEKFKCRSMSVGDIVEFDGKRFRCDPVGWTL